MLEYERLEQNDLFSTIKRNAVSCDIVTVLVHNVRSLTRHGGDILSDNRIANNDIIGFTETETKPSDSTSKRIETFNVFNIDFNITENKVLSLACGCRNDVAVLSKFDANRVSTLNFKKHTFAYEIVTLMLVYRKSMPMQEFFQMMQYLLAAYSINIIAVECNYDF